MPKRTTTVVPVVRRMPDGRLGVVEKHMTTQKRLTKDEQLAQATAIMHRRLFDPNASVANLATEFGVCKDTIESRLRQARQDGVPSQAREIFIQELLPMSMAVLVAALQGEDKKLAATVALKVVDGLKAMELPNDRPDTAAGDGDSFEIFRERIKLVRKGDSPAVQTADPEAGGITIEATPLPFTRSEPAGPSAASDPSSPGSGSGESGVEAV